MKSLCALAGSDMESSFSYSAIREEACVETSGSYSNEFQRSCISWRVNLREKHTAPFAKDSNEAPVYKYHKDQLGLGTKQSISSKVMWVQVLMKLSKLWGLVSRISFTKSQAQLLGIRITMSVCWLKINNKNCSEYILKGFLLRIKYSCNANKRNSKGNKTFAIFKILNPRVRLELPQSKFLLTEKCTTKFTITGEEKQNC